MKKDITTVNVSESGYAGKLNHKELKLIGAIDLSALAELNRHDFDFLDISEAEFGIVWAGATAALSMVTAAGAMWRY